jgi:hypothetical protein
MAFLYSVLPEYTKNSDVLTDSNARGRVKSLEEFLNTVDEEIFDVVADSVREILSFGSVYEISDEYLPYLAYLLGYKWNYSLDLSIQRNLLANILRLYKRKGTKFSFNFSLYNLDPSISLYEPYKDIFILNKSGFDEFDYESYPSFTLKAPVRAATVGSIELSGIQVVDGVRVKSGDRVLVKNQSDPTENGVYTAGESSWVRSEDADAESELLYSLYYVEEGLVNKNKGWVCTGADLTSGVVFERLKFKGVKKYHLSSRNYYSWGILVLSLSSLYPETYDLLAMVKPAGWKAIVELQHKLYYSWHYKVEDTARSNYISTVNLTGVSPEVDKDYYSSFINSIHYYDLRTLYSITFAGSTFSLGGSYHSSLLNGTTLNDIGFYNLYYETESSSYTLLRYPAQYSYHSNTQPSWW